MRPDSTARIGHADEEAERIAVALTRYRLAGRSPARDEELGPHRLVALVELVQAARQEFAGDGWLRVAAQRVIYAEAFELLVYGRTPMAPRASWQGDPVTRQLQHLRRQGFERCSGCERCTGCSRPIPSLDVLSMWEDWDRAAWQSRIRAEAAGEATSGRKARAAA